MFDLLPFDYGRREKPIKSKLNTDQYFVYIYKQLYSFIACLLSFNYL